MTATTLIAHVVFFLLISIMTTAILLLNTDLGHEKEILAALGAIENVKEAHQVYGVYDIIAKVEAESLEKVKDIVTGRMRRLDKVRSTLTMVVVE